jgi:hypothetical protein
MDSDSDQDRRDSELIADLKRYARVLHRRTADAQPDALRRMRALREFARASDREIAAAVQRKHALAVTALQLGFTSWTHALEVLAGPALTRKQTAAAESADLGTLLHCSGHTNIWSAHSDEAREATCSAIGGSS